jgi:hypothetical protein
MIRNSKINNTNYFACMERDMHVKFEAECFTAEQEIGPFCHGHDNNFCKTKMLQFLLFVGTGLNHVTDSSQ